MKQSNIIAILKMALLSFAFADPLPLKKKYDINYATQFSPGNIRIGMSVFIFNVKKQHIFHGL